MNKLHLNSLPDPNALRRRPVVPPGWSQRLWGGSVGLGPCRAGQTACSPGKASLLVLISLAVAAGLMGGFTQTSRAQRPKLPGGYLTHQPDTSFWLSAGPAVQVFRSPWPGRLVLGVVLPHPMPLQEAEYAAPDLLAELWMRPPVNAPDTGGLSQIQQTYAAQWSLHTGPTRSVLILEALAPGLQAALNTGLQALARPALDTFSLFYAKKRVLQNWNQQELTPQTYLGQQLNTHNPDCSPTPTYRQLQKLDSTALKQWLQRIPATGIRLLLFLPETTSLPSAIQWPAWNPRPLQAPAQAKPAAPPTQKGDANPDSLPGQVDSQARKQPPEAQPTEPAPGDSQAAAAKPPERTLDTTARWLTHERTPVPLLRRQLALPYQEAPDIVLLAAEALNGPAGVLMRNFQALQIPVQVTTRLVQQPGGLLVQCDLSGPPKLLGLAHAAWDTVFARLVRPGPYTKVVDTTDLRQAYQRLVYRRQQLNAQPEAYLRQWTQLAESMRFPQRIPAKDLPELATMHELYTNWARQPGWQVGAVFSSSQARAGNLPGAFEQDWRPPPPPVVWDSATCALVERLRREAAERAQPPCPQIDPPPTRTSLLAPPGEPLPNLRPVEDLMVSFQLGDTLLNENHWGKLSQVAQWLRGAPDAQLFVDGHSSPSEPQSRQLALSWSRAREVSRLLQEVFDAPAYQLELRGFGAAQPLPPNSDASAARVTFTWVQ